MITVIITQIRPHDQEESSLELAYSPGTATCNLQKGFRVPQLRSALHLKQSPCESHVFNEGYESHVFTTFSEVKNLGLETLKKEWF